MANRTCTVDGCEGAHQAKGLCKRHYRQAWYREHRGHELATMAGWRASHVEYNRQRLADYRTANSDRLSAAFKAFYQANREALLERAAKYRAAHPDACREWREANPDAFSLANRANAGKYRAADKGVECDVLLAADYRAILDRDGMVCHICGGQIASLDDLHFDHVIPLSKGGPHSVDNIRPSHGPCNMRKGNRLIA